MKPLAILLAAVLTLAVVVAVERHHDKPLILAAGVVATPPVAGGPVRVLGTVGAVAAHVPPKPHPHRTTLNTTAYCSTGNRTASGVLPTLGMAASNLYPFGTRLLVPGIGVVTITDRTDDLTQLDIYMGAAGCGQRATAFGRRQLEVTVLP